MRKSVIHDGASRFICVTLDPPCKCASEMYLQASRTSYSSRRSRVARRRNRKLDRSWVIQKSHQIYHISSRVRADFPKLSQTIVALVSKVGSVGKHIGDVAAKSFCARNAAIARRQETLAVTPRKFPLCSTNSHPAVQKDGLTVLIRSAGPAAQCLVARELGVHFPLPGRSRETRPVRLVHHRDDPTSTTNRLVSRDGRKKPVQCDSYITTMTPPRPQTDWCPVIFFTSSF